MNRRAVARPLLALVVLVGCATARRAPHPPPPVDAATDAGAPVAAVDVSTPPIAPEPTVPSRPPPDPQALQGSEVFMRVCGPCHLGMWQVPSGGSLSAANRSEAAIRRQIRQGSGSAPNAMPAIGVDRLPESEMPALLAYLRQLHVVAPR